MAGARAAHLMLYAGVRDVRLLEGGLASWRTAGLPLQAGSGPQQLAASHFEADFPGYPHDLVGTAVVQSLLLQAAENTAKERVAARLIRLCGQAVLAFRQKPPAR